MKQNFLRKRQFFIDINFNDFLNWKINKIDVNVTAKKSATGSAENTAKSFCDIMQGII